MSDPVLGIFIICEELALFLTPDQQINKVKAFFKQML